MRLFCAKRSFQFWVLGTAEPVPDFSKVAVMVGTGGIDLAWTRSHFDALGSLPMPKKPEVQTEPEHEMPAWGILDSPASWYALIFDIGVNFQPRQTFPRANPALHNRGIIRGRENRV